MVPKTKVERSGIAFEPKQLREFDALIKRKGYKNRSEAVRGLIRKEFIEEEQNDPDARMMATLTIVYGHEEHDVQHNLTHLQHHHAGLIRSTMHVHMDEDNCLEVLVLEGRVRDMKRLADSLLAQKGVKHGRLVLTGVV